jgi:hypothetical protein
VERLELDLQGETFISRFLAADERQRLAMRTEGAALAGQLRRRAIDLAQSKATEFSPKIRIYHQLAAKVALLAHWPDSEALEIYERDIRYYRNFESTQALVDEYEDFREVYIRSAFAC